jgi:hypothetical protein
VPDLATRRRVPKPAAVGAVFVRRAARALDASRPMRYQSATLLSRAPGVSMSIDTSDGHSAMDYREHVRTYNGFIKGTIVLTVLVALILLGMLIFLV